jgi:hypothetical protein
MRSKYEYRSGIAITNYNVTNPKGCLRCLLAICVSSLCELDITIIVAIQICVSSLCELDITIIVAIQICVSSLCELDITTIVAIQMLPQLSPFQFASLRPSSFVGPRQLPVDA